MTARAARPAGVALVFVVSASLLAQQRDARVTPAGTGEIAGVVMSADTAPQPVRRVVVTIVGGDLPSARSIVTDDTGRFAFTGLPAGDFTVTARKAAYLPAEYGSVKPGRAGSKIALATGERRAITLTIARGAVIAGTLRDPAGAPIAGVSVLALARATLSSPEFRPIGSQGIQPPEAAVTDDRGAYRIYGLMPGEYVVVASPSPGGAGEIGAPSSADVDAILAAVRQRSAAAMSPAEIRAATTPAVPPAPASIGFAPIYFPGTPLYPEAARIRVAAGEEREAVHFVVGHVPVASIEGTISGSVPNLAAVQLAIVPDAPRVTSVPGTGGITSHAPNAAGEFKYGNLSPGRYRIVARVRGGQADPDAPPPGAAVTVSGGLRGGAPLPGINVQPTGEMLYGVADVEVRGQDVKGVALQLRPGGTMSGRIVFDAESAQVPADLSDIRVGLYLSGGSYVSSAGATRVGNALSSLQAVNAAPDGSFTINGIGPEVYYVSCQLPGALSSTWKLRSAMVDGRDLLDSLVQGPEVDLRGVTLTLSDKRTALSGTLQSPIGEPVSDYFVVAFSADRAHWRAGSRRTHTARPATDGRFVFDDLPAGDYLIAALTDLDPADLGDPAFLEQIAPAGVRVTMAEGEKQRQDLRIR